MILYNIINQNFNEYVHHISLNNNNHKERLKYLDEYSFYTKYHRGKSYDILNENKIDIPFELNYNEAIMFHKKLNCKPKDPGTILITINDNGIYNVYEFCQEVSSEDYTLEYYGFDDSDYNKQVLIIQTVFDKISEINITIALSNKNKDMHHENWDLCDDYLNYDDIMKEIFDRFKMI